MVRPQSLDEAARNCRRRVGWSWTGSVAVDMAECRLDFETMHHGQRIYDQLMSVSGRLCCKTILPSQRLRLTQDQASMRNVDSRIHSLRFDCCIFLFYSLSAVTFATQSPRKQTSSDTTGMSALPKADICSAANSVSSACRDRQERGGRAAAEQLFIK